MRMGWKKIRIEVKGVCGLGRLNGRIGGMR